MLFCRRNLSNWLIAVEMKKLLSPLRYPGGKSRVAQFLEDLIVLNNLENITLFEFYAGGAGASLDLLNRNIVDHIVLNDLDYHIYAFWKSVLNETENFISFIEKTEITIKNWEEQKHIYNNYKNFELLEVGFSTFFLNRTNRSGVLNAGPIGGKNQTGNYKMDVRFNKTGLIERILQIAELKKDISLFNVESINLLKKTFNETNSNHLYFLDPPYYKQGKNLYFNFYNPDDHLALSQLLEANRDANWFLTYDNCNEIKRLYHSFSQAYLPMTYTLQRKIKTKEIMIFSDNLIIPKNLRMGKKNRELRFT